MSNFNLTPEQKNKILEETKKRMKEHAKELFKEIIEKEPMSADEVIERHVLEVMSSGEFNISLDGEDVKKNIVDIDIAEGYLPLAHNAKISVTTLPAALERISDPEKRAQLISTLAGPLHWDLVAEPGKVLEEHGEFANKFRATATKIHGLFKDHHFSEIKMTFKSSSFYHTTEEYLEDLAKILKYSLERPMGSFTAPSYEKFFSCQWKLQTTDGVILELLVVEE